MPKMRNKITWYSEETVFLVVYFQDILNVAVPTDQGTKPINDSNSMKLEEVLSYNYLLVKSEAKGAEDKISKVMKVLHNRLTLEIVSSSVFVLIPSHAEFLRNNDFHAPGQNFI